MQGCLDVASVRLLAHFLGGGAAAAAGWCPVVVAAAAAGPRDLLLEPVQHGRHLVELGLAVAGVVVVVLVVLAADDGRDAVGELQGLVDAGFESLKPCVQNSIEVEHGRGELLAVAQAGFLGGLGQLGLVFAPMSGWTV